MSLPDIPPRGTKGASESARHLRCYSLSSPSRLLLATKEGPSLRGPSSHCRLNSHAYLVPGGKDPKESREGTCTPASSGPTPNQHLVRVVSAGQHSVKTATPTSVFLQKRSQVDKSSLLEQVLGPRTQQVLPALSVCVTLVPLWGFRTRHPETCLCGVHAVLS